MRANIARTKAALPAAPSDKAAPVLGAAGLAARRSLGLCDGGLVTRGAPQRRGRAPLCGARPRREALAEKLGNWRSALNPRRWLTGDRARGWRQLAGSVDQCGTPLTRICAASGAPIAPVAPVAEVEAGPVAASLALPAATSVSVSS